MDTVLRFNGSLEVAIKATQSAGAGKAIIGHFGDDIILKWEETKSIKCFRDYIIASDAGVIMGNSSLQSDSFRRYHSSIVMEALRSVVDFSRDYYFTSGVKGLYSRDYSEFSEFVDGVSFGEDSLVSGQYICHSLSKFTPVYSDFEVFKRVFSYTYLLIILEKIRGNCMARLSFVDTCLLLKKSALSTSDIAAAQEVVNFLSNQFENADFWISRAVGKKGIECILQVYNETGGKSSVAIRTHKQDDGAFYHYQGRGESVLVSAFNEGNIIFIVNDELQASGIDVRLKYNDSFNGVFTSPPF